MTWRAFLLGLALSGLLNWSDVYCGWAHLWGRMTESNFPVSCVFVLVVLTLIVNVLIKLVRKSWAFKQAELMLIWCMLLVASSIPTTGLQRFWLPMLAGPPYMAGRSDIGWRETALKDVPDSLVLSKDPKSVAARQFYEGRPEGRVPWRQWCVPLLSWGAFHVIFITAVLLMCVLLRKQWVDQERLQFPLARVPLEFSEGSAGEGWLPTVFSNRAFVLGFAGAAAFRLVRATPLLFGGTSAWTPTLPLQTIFTDTALADAKFVNVPMSWIALGFAFLVPVDVSLSVWLIYLFTRAELLVAAKTGSTIGGSNLLSWQMGGAYVAFTVGAVVMCRRHFTDIVRSAFGRGRHADGAEEVLPLGWAF
jgi:hypothetical protein